MLLLEFVIMALALVSGRFALAQTPGESEVEVQLKQGLIKGMKEDAGEGHSIYSFKSIPFAEPPVGDLRFRDPLPAGAWSGVRDGTIDPLPCLGFNITAIFMDEIQVVGQEDCLYLNVFTPDVDRSDLPVMVWIHGGAFVLGGIATERPVPDLIRNVVFVAIQYRLATLGFLSTEDSVLPGNMGLKDQTLALRWVHDNIRDLGGDPQKVTVFGESAGGASTHLQVLSPHATGLFQRVILQSGTALSPWATGDNHAETAKEIGEMFECQAQDSTALLNCLQTVSAEELTKAAASQYVWEMSPSVMTPRVDGDFLPNYPATLLRNGVYNKVDLISGITRNEGAYIVQSLSDPKKSENFVQNFSTVGPLALMLRDLDYNPIYLSRRMYIKYVGGINADEDSYPKIEKLFTDRIFAVPHDETVMLHSRDTLLGKNVFAYELKHRGQMSLADFMQSNASSEDYVSHGDDLLYLFTTFGPLNDTSDLQVRDVFINTWTNFAATGHPTPDYSLGYKWLPVTSPSSCLQHLDIVPTPFMHDDTRFKIRNFWKRLATHQNTILYPEIFYRESLFVAPDLPDPCTFRNRSPFSQWFFVSF